MNTPKTSLDDIMATSNAAASAAMLFGTAGNDTINGSAGDDQLFGQSGDDILNGKGGNDVLAGGDGNDTLTGGTGNDQLFGESGDDRFVWNAGDGSDLVEGGVGTDTLAVNGSAGNDEFFFANNGDHLAIGNGAGELLLNVGGVESVVISTGAGDDIVTGQNGVGQLTSMTIDGGSGNDTITGGDGDDLLLGGTGNDRITGARGVDTARLGAGDDTFVWNPGDGSDIVEGDAGTDTLAFNGSNIGEQIGITANGARASLFRNVAGVTMDMKSVERIDVATLGGSDRITVGDLHGTDVKQVNVDLSQFGGGADADGDAVDVHGSDVRDKLVVATIGDSAVVTGGAATVTVNNAGAGDTLIVSADNGDDTIDASRMAPGLLQLIADGGAGDDTIIGSQGNDLLIGGTGNDSFQFTAGIGNDTFDGGDGTDRLSVTGTEGADTVLIQRNVGAVVSMVGATVTTNGEAIGVENVVISTGAGDDIITGSNGLSTVTTLLTIDGGAGNDTITGGDGADLLIGGLGNDLIDGGRGNDTAQMGAGDDTFFWSPGEGSDTVEGDAGTDTLVFDGSNIQERIDISANATRVRMTRDVANVTMDLNRVERIEVNALGGTDSISVGDLSGTGVKAVDIDLGAFGGGADAAADTVSVSGSGGRDKVVVQGSGNSVTVSGTPATVTVTNTESIDSVIVSTQAGDDTITVGGMSADSGHLFIDAGAGNDTVVSSGSNVAENIDVFSDGASAFVARGADAVRTQMSGVETLNVAASSGSDHVGVFDLTGSGLSVVNVMLGGADGKADMVADTIDITSTRDADSLIVKTVGSETVITGLGAEVHVRGADAGLDQLVIHAGDGDDTIDAASFGAKGPALTVFGGRGADHATLGSGNDTFVWNPGDGSDTVDGRAGTDLLQFNGANVTENYSLTAVGGHVSLFRDVGNVTMDLKSVEHINLATFGNPDSITIHDMTGTDLREFDLDLGGNGENAGAGDKADDLVTIEGTSGSDHITLSMKNGALVVDGLAAQIVISNFEAGDAIHVLGLGGDDVIDASLLGSDGPALVFDGGDGDDVLIGGAGNDELHGGANDDVLIGNAGADFLDGGTGDNVLFQESADSLHLQHDFTPLMA